MNASSIVENQQLINLVTHLLDGSIWLYILACLVGVFIGIYSNYMGYRYSDEYLSEFRRYNVHMKLKYFWSDFMLIAQICAYLILYFLVFAGAIPLGVYFICLFCTLIYDVIHIRFRLKSFLYFLKTWYFIFRYGTSVKIMETGKTK